MELNEQLALTARHLADEWQGSRFMLEMEKCRLQAGPQSYVVATMVLDGRRGDTPPRLTMTVASHGGPLGSLVSRPVAQVVEARVRGWSDDVLV